MRTDSGSAIKVVKSSAEHVAQEEHSLACITPADQMRRARDLSLGLHFLKFY